MSVFPNKSRSLIYWFSTQPLDGNKVIDEQKKVPDVKNLRGWTQQTFGGSITAGVESLEAQVQPRRPIISLP